MQVPHYVIADMETAGDRRRLKLIAYRLDGKAYEPVELGARGRAWLEPVGLWLGVKADPVTGGDRVVLIDPESDQELADYTAIHRALAEAEARAAAAVARRRELEAEIQRLSGGKGR